MKRKKETIRRKREVQDSNDYREFIDNLFRVINIICEKDEKDGLAHLKNASIRKFDFDPEGDEEQCF